MTRDTTLEEAALSIIKQNELKPAREIVTALIAAEKNAKKQKISYSFKQLIGTWKLSFITGTKKTRKKAGVVLGAGKYLPKLTKITISYQPTEDAEANRGTVENCVDLKLFKVSLAGLIKFIPQRNLLVFDFTRMHLIFLGISLYNGYIRSGKEKEATFYTDSLKEQAFFTYFYVDNYAIAARGKGGGLALWTRADLDLEDSSN